MLRDHYMSKFSPVAASPPPARIHSSNNARDLILLIDLLHVLVNLLQRLIELLQMCLTSPSVRQVHGEKKDTSKSNKYPSCASARMS